MILTCPNCATDFFVDDHLVGPTGRQVKCDECGEVWMAGVMEPAPPVAPLAAEPDLERMKLSPPPLPAAPMFAAPKPSAPAPKRAPSQRRRLIIALLIVALVVIGLIVWQGDIVKAWPAAADAYRALGLAAEPSAPGHG